MGKWGHSLRVNDHFSYRIMKIPPKIRQEKPLQALYYVMTVPTAKALPLHSPVRYKCIEVAT